jgi:hypothetical protein
MARRLTTQWVANLPHLRIQRAGEASLGPPSSRAHPQTPSSEVIHPQTPSSEAGVPHANGRSRRSQLVSTVWLGAGNCSMRAYPPEPFNAAWKAPGSTRSTGVSMHMAIGG